MDRLSSRIGVQWSPLAPGVPQARSCTCSCTASRSTRPPSANHGAIWWLAPVLCCINAPDADNKLEQLDRGDAPPPRGARLRPPSVRTNGAPATLQLQLLTAFARRRIRPIHATPPFRSTLAASTASPAASLFCLDLRRRCHHRLSSKPGRGPALTPAHRPGHCAPVRACPRARTRASVTSEAGMAFFL